jgi:DNA-binding response OmpR family regulator
MNNKVLVADDDQTVLMTARMFLEGKGYEVITVDNGEDVIEKLNQQKPEVILLDVKMPGKDGFQVCREIKETEKTKDTIVIIFSGVIKEIEKGFDYGADDCFTKPLEWDSFVQRIEELKNKKNEAEPGLKLAE